ncbi:hypothetical protein C8D76_103129 [Pasteurella langaaensis DSM 22999]|uniref:Uncharacterized protein n=1 Tax=Alitibacter langaaensis DSM 22999 TaxID=1122935 RepID=A0A2U0TAC0_9PAST|nr:hypothetical protein [Pasteurella langaaensis]PVX40556.1 hypothetical protein C8D76_103129 [Pasteurella langaaensis DSM 22999]
MDNTNIKINLKCPKCGGEIEDLSTNDDWGWFVEEPYRCNGHYTGKYKEFCSEDSAMNRTKSCGWFTKEQVQDGL